MTGVDLATNDPKLNDPKLNDPKLNDPKLNDPKLNDPKLNDPKLNDPKANDPKANDPSTTPQPLQYEQVWNYLRGWFKVLFVLTVGLIVLFAVAMIVVVYKTALADIQATHSGSKDAPDLVQSSEAGGEPIVIVEDAARIRTSEALAILGSLQVALVMFLGFSCIFYGLLLTCLGVTAGYDVKASGSITTSPATFSIASSSPGLLFLIVGGIMITCALFRQLDYRDKVVVPYGSNPPPSGDSVPGTDFGKKPPPISDTIPTTDAGKKKG